MDSVWDSVGDSVFGAHDAGWLSLYDYFLRQCDLKCCEPFAGVIDLAHHCGWWIPYRNAAFVQHRHCELHRDARGRLHNPNGMAVKYRDGWGVYAMHGVRLPWQLIEQPETNTPAAIEAEPNAEIRRIRIERYGFDRWIVDASLSPIQQDDFGKLYKRTVGTDRVPIAIVEVSNSTAEPNGTFKKYYLPVRSTVKTAREAVASSFGLQEMEYAPCVET